MVNDRDVPDEPAEVPTPIAYVRPDLDALTTKQVCLLARTRLTKSAVQIVRSGGENNLHSHRHQEGTWFVLAGAARFYTTGDEVVAELGPYEGIVIPRNYPYWFEKIGPDDLEILQFEASDVLKGPGRESAGWDRVDLVGSLPAFDDQGRATGQEGTA